MNRIPCLSLLASLIAGQLFPANGLAQEKRWSPCHVYYGAGGVLSYAPDEQGNILPDFSHVGYMYGESSIPDIPVVVEVSPVEGDDGASIQAAIDQVEAMLPDENGFRGAVLIKKGTYEVSGQLRIRSSGVVLRGEGQDDQGTVIRAEGTETRDLILVDNGSSLSVDQASAVNVAEDHVPVGRKFVVVSDASAFAAGDHMALYRPGTQNWISDIKMDQITPSEGTVQWKPSSYSFYFERLVTRVNGDTIFFKNPVVMAMEAEYGGGKVYKASFDRLEKVGVEDLCLKSAYASDTDENHSWKAIAFRSVENGWVRRVTSWYFAYSCVSLERSSRLISVLDCHCREPKSVITGGRRYSFNLVGSLNLFHGCTTTEGRHDFVSSSRVCGPNVFTRCSAANTHSDIGPHHRWAMGTLYDVITSDGAINVQDRDDMGTGHGWAGANQVFWNCNAASSVCQSPWASALNYNFGFIGNKSSGARGGRPDGEWVGHNVPGIFPESLYEAQLEARLSATPYFAVYPGLEAVDDSSFVLVFNMPFDSTSIAAENFSVSGTAGLEGKEFSLAMLGDSAVSLTFQNMGELPAYGTVVVSAAKVSSVDGLALTGATSALYVAPDLRPVVNGMGLIVNNEDGFVVASSSKTGLVYIVKHPGSYQSAADLEQAVSDNQGQKAEAPEPNVSVPIYTRGLPGGYYSYYAVDQEGRMSEPDSKRPIIQETGPVTDLQTFLPETGFEAWYAQGLIQLRVQEDLGSYSIQIFDLRGSLLDQKMALEGNQQFRPPAASGPILLRKISTHGTETKKLMIW